MRFWWAEVDSNHRSRRRQIYSLIHLAALESAHMKLCAVRCGAGDWTRTHNLLITNQLLCQLSYTVVFYKPLPRQKSSRLTRTTDNTAFLALPQIKKQNVCPNGHTILFGALGRNRTTDRQIFSLLLYRLSYQGIYGDPERARTVDLQRDRLAL